MQGPSCTQADGPHDRLVSAWEAHQCDRGVPATHWLRRTDARTAASEGVSRAAGGHRRRFQRCRPASRRWPRLNEHCAIDSRFQRGDLSPQFGDAGIEPLRRDVLAVLGSARWPAGWLACSLADLDAPVPLGPWSILPVHSGPGLRLPAVVVVSHSATGWKRGAAESVSGWSRWRRLTGSSPSRVRHNPRVDCTWKWVHRPRPDHFRAGNQGLHSRSRESAPNSARGRRGGASRKACRPVTARAAEPRPTPISEQPHMARRPAVLDVAQAEHQIQVIL